MTQTLFSQVTKLRILRTAFLSLLSIGLLTACERTVDLELPATPPLLVVEGYIEPGLPPIVLLSESQPVFTPLSAASLTDALVHDARITVTTNGDSSFILREVAADSLPLVLRQALAEQAGLTLDPVTGRLPVPLTFYTSIPTAGEPSLVGRVGRTYVLHVEARGQMLSAITTIPHLTPLDSIWFEPATDPTLADSLLTLYYAYQDPDTIGNATRAFTKVNHEPFYPPTLQSAFTDEFVNGRRVTFALDRGRPRSLIIDGNRAALFRRGDTVTVRWCAIDQPHFKFWLSYDNALNINGSPLSAPSVLATNIRGGLGIWGGYGTTYSSAVAPR
jgi:Domain of unknown function (DUF4249)